MNKEDEDNLLNWLKDKDVSEVMNLLMRHGNRYSRRILKFFRWFCKYVPIIIMCLHAYGMWDFSQHPREMFITNNENFSCYLFIYFMVYVLPMVFDISKQVLLPLLEIQNTIFLFLRHQCGSYRGMELVHNQKYDRFLFYGYDCNGNVLSIWICRYVYQ